MLVLAVLSELLEKGFMLFGVGDNAIQLKLQNRILGHSLFRRIQHRDDAADSSEKTKDNQNHYGDQDKLKKPFHIKTFNLAIDSTPGRQIEQIRKTWMRPLLAPDLYCQYSMNLWAKRLWEIAVILSIFMPSAPLFALSESRAGNDESYERLEHEFVLSSRNEVIAYCDAGDTMIKATCDAKAQNIVPDQNRYLYDMPHRSANRDEGLVDINLFENREIHEQGRAGIACRVKIVRADQELRVTAAIKCKKAGEKAFSHKKSPALKPG